MKYLGMRPGDLEGKPYARFYQPVLAPLPAAVREALLVGPVPGQLLERDLENGYGVSDGGALRVTVRTDMPGVSPAMIDWWFGWHGDEPQRYKLWHPQAHVHACWTQPGQGYLGRTSMVDEYIGSTLRRASIRFVPAPATDEVVVRAHIGVFGVEIGMLEHRVAPVPGGSVMRSAFCFGGQHAPGPLRLMTSWVKPPAGYGRDLLVHCSQEMSHLASFLPELHSELA